MTDFVPLRKMQERVRVDRTESDSTTFLTLMYFGEMLFKLTVAGLVSALPDDRDRTRYRIAHGLVRADGLGEWNNALDDLLIGPSSHHLGHSARDERTELTQRVPSAAWQYRACQSLSACLYDLRIEAEPLQTKLSLRRWFSDFVALRNKTRGHGAILASLCGHVCPKLEESLNALTSSMALFRRPWAYLYRNLSGKYRVTPLNTNADVFSPLKKKTDLTLSNGVYIHFWDFRRVELIESDPEATDFFFPNGGFSAKKRELLSYITGETVQCDNADYLTPCEELPTSESQGIGEFVLVRVPWNRPV